MKIAIAGASGFLGSHLVEKLSKNSANEITALVRKSSSTKFLSERNAKIVTVDYDNSEDLKSVLIDCNVVINCIALLGDYDHLPSSDHFNVDAGIVKKLYEALKDSQIKQFIHVSTTGVYGGKSTTEPVNESEEFGDVSSKYELGKVEAEKLLIEYKKADFPVTVARPGAIFGPRMMYGWPNMIQRMKSGSFPIIGKGETLFHVTYIDDIVEGISLLIGKDSAIGESFNVCGEEVPTISNYFKAINSGANGPTLKHIPYSPVYFIALCLQYIPKFLKPGDLSLLSPARVRFFAEHRIYDISKLKKMYNYESKVSLEDGIDRTIRWYTENGIIT